MLPATERPRGLGAIHASGAIHRDLKPENVLITGDHTVKVMDLGVARLADEAIRLSQSGVFVGSILYAAPEQFRPAAGGARGGDARVDSRADLYALGVVLYELSTGLHPVSGDDFPSVLRAVLEQSPRRPAELNPQLSPFFEELVLRLLAKDRDARFATASEVEDALAQGEDSAWWRKEERTIRAATQRPLRRIRIPRETVKAPVRRSSTSVGGKVQHPASAPTKVPRRAECAQTEARWGAR